MFLRSPEHSHLGPGFHNGWDRERSYCQIFIYFGKNLNIENHWIPQVNYNLKAKLHLLKLFPTKCFSPIFRLFFTNFFFAIAKTS
jgi:hypothetical protein